MNLGLIGNPVEKSISPQLHKILFKELDLSNFRYEKYEIRYEPSRIVRRSNTFDELI